MSLWYMKRRQDNNEGSSENVTTLNQLPLSDEVKEAVETLAKPIDEPKKKGGRPRKVV